MRLWLLPILILTINSAIAKEVKDFNKVLLDNVQKDLQKDNEKYRVKKPMRGPASVQPDWTPESNSKIDKNERQIGPNKW